MSSLHLLPAAGAALLLLLPSPASAQLTAATTGGVAGALSGAPANRATQSWSQWQPKPSYAPNQLPDQYMGQNRAGPNSEDQTGFNTCLRTDGSWNQQSQCQTAWVNSVDDFCVWGPPEPGTVGATERRAVAYCTKPGHGTRLIPEGTIKSAHFVQTSEYVQITGQADFTSIGIPLGDDGGEMDSAGADDLSNPIGGVVYTTAQPSANGSPVMAAEWTNFMSFDRFCFRVCFGNNAEKRCQHIYDVLGCAWNLPANYGDGFDSCDGDLALFQGEYVQPNGQTSTFKQGDPVTPDPHPAPSSSNCRAASSVNNGGLLIATPLAALSSASSPAAGAGAAQSTLSNGQITTVVTGPASRPTAEAAATGINGNTAAGNSGSSSAAAAAAQPARAAAGATAIAAVAIAGALALVGLLA